MRLLITGGTSDIGAAIARRREALGDQIIISSSNAENLKKGLSHLTGSAEGLVFDLEHPENSREDLKKILSDGLDGVIFNASTRLNRLKFFHEMSAEEFNAFFIANTIGNMWLVREILPYFIQKNFGRMVFISSLVAQMGTSRYSAYCSAKAALEGFFLNLAVDYGSHNILSSVVRPGIIQTSRNRKFWRREVYVEKTSAFIPQGKMGQPDQVAEALDPLLSLTSYMNGSVIEVSGGLPKFRTAGLF